MRHLEDIKKTWYQHFKFAMSLSITLARLSICGFIHALFPNIFVTTVSDGVSDLKETLDNFK